MSDSMPTPYIKALSWATLQEDYDDGYFWYMELNCKNCRALRPFYWHTANVVAQDHEFYCTHNFGVCPQIVMIKEKTLQRRYVNGLLVRATKRGEIPVIPAMPTSLAAALAKPEQGHPSEFAVARWLAEIEALNAPPVEPESFAEILHRHSYVFPTLLAKR